MAGLDPAIQLFGVGPRMAGLAAGHEGCWDGDPW